MQNKCRAIPLILTVTADSSLILLSSYMQVRSWSIDIIVLGYSSVAKNKTTNVINYYYLLNTVTSHTAYTLQQCNFDCQHRLMATLLL